jgi:PKD repeat protein
VAGQSIEVELQPFEVLVFDASAEVYPFMEISAPKGPAPQTLRFDLSDSMIPAAFVRYELDCDGDGVVDATTGQMRLFTYETPGAYTARLTVYDAEGRQSSTTATVVIPETVAPREEVYLSNLDWVSDSVGYGGQTKRDLSIDGNPLTLNGTVYAKGLGTHAQSEIVYALNGGYETFRAVLGVDDEVLDTNAYGDVVFKVLGDGALLYTSPGVDPLSEPISLELDVTGVQSLQLVVEEGDNNFADHANWADARLVPLESGFAAWVSDKGLSGDPEADTDGDGLSDFAEYGLGLDPAVEDAAGTVEFSVTADGVARYRFPDAVTALNFTLETSEDLQNWRPFNGPLVSDPPHFEVSVPRGDGEPEAPLFLRLRLSE